MKDLRVSLGLLVVAGLVLPAQGHAAYKWVDSDGQVHYTQEPPPPGVEGREIAAPRPPSDAGQEQERVQQLQEDLDARRNERLEQEKEATEDAEYAAAKKQRCEAARKRLESAQRPLTNFVDPDGTQRRATEEERQQQIREAEGQVSEFCG